MKDNLSKLTDLLRELFQLDQADLDFGIYRIMNARRDEINRFLTQDLLPQVREAFSEYKSADKALLKQELDKAIDGAKALGYDPDTAPKVKELREKYEASSVDVAGLENEVYDHLYSFFKRYYDEGDFISLRRYKEGVYAIPYEGEEVKLYWANHDQYYIKTTENFRDYAFKLTDGSRVHFKIVEADTEKDNIKSTNGKDRRFSLVEENPVTEDNGELIIHFEYKPDEQKRKQEPQINQEIVHRVMGLLKTEGLESWEPNLTTNWKRADGTATDKTVLAKHLSDYTRRNTFDYFIHKNLGEFLRRELDFYIKNEVMRLDDVESESVPRVEQYLSKIKVIRRIAHKIIDFLAQIEDFQKKLWLKKKFVVETNYCITLDRVPEELYPDIASNEAQREEWVRLFAIDEIKGDVVTHPYAIPLTVEFLKANPYLVLDTRLFDASFKAKLLETVDNIDARCEGIIIHSENFQALNLIQQRYRKQIKCTYIDPPYNKENDHSFAYKDNFAHSSWLAMMSDRLNLAHQLLNDEGVLFSSIDDHEILNLMRCAEQDGFFHGLKMLPAITNLKGNYDAEGFVATHEYVCAIAKPGLSIIGELPIDEEKVEEEWNEDDYGLWKQGDGLRRTGEAAPRAERPKGWFPIFFTKDGKLYVTENDEPLDKNDLIIWPINDDGDELSWTWSKTKISSESHNLFVKQKGDKLTIYKKQRPGLSGIPSRKAKSFLYSPEYSSTTGGNIATEIFGFRISEYTPKAPKLLYDLCVLGTKSPSDLVMDFFAGSGTTGHSLLNRKRLTGQPVKYILVEMGQYFDDILLTRLKKVTYSVDWKGGKPVSRNGISHMFKYLHLESYEDALANIQLTRTDAQRELLESSASFLESYMLKYMLEAESKGSPSLLSIDRFEDPFSYQLLVGTGSVGETKPVNVDLVETFNWLLGIRVQSIMSIQGYHIVEGTNPKVEKVLVIWRKIRDLDETDPEKIAEARQKANDDLDTFFQEQQYNKAESYFDIIYVNGDNNLMNIPVEPGGGEPPYRVRLIEEEFKRLMFDVKDV